MHKDLEKIAEFIKEHHVMSLATCADDDLSVCSLFYVFDVYTLSFIVASSEDTTHIRHIKRSEKVAGNIVLETKEVSKIQGVQFRGKMQKLQEGALQVLYFKRFPYATALLPSLWQIKVHYFKMTDNRLGFGKKIIFEDVSL